MGILVADILLLCGVSYSRFTCEGKDAVLICTSCLSEASGVVFGVPHDRALLLVLDTVKDTLILIVGHVG